MATVYRAYQPSLEREVALKVLPDFLIDQPGFKARFHREAVAVARLQHPNILSVFDHGEQDGVTYIVSEYVEGGTLASRMGAPIQLDYCVRILRPIADALDYAHSEGVIHRDVKPSNILLDRRGVPILSDFGLARVAEAAGSERLTQTGAMVGTPTYMAPEQCAGQEAGAPADIYALAVIAFEMVTGRVPFSSPTPLGVIAAHQLTPPPSPRKFNPSLPQVVELPLLAGLAKDPAKRPETATDFIEALAAAITSSPSMYPLTPPPITPLPPTPTGVYTETPAPSYAPPAPPPAPSPAPYVAPPYVAPPYVAPQYVAPAATPPPSYPPPAPVVPQPAYAPVPPPVYSTPRQWTPQPIAPRAGAPVWVIVSLWAGVALGVLGLVLSIVYELFGTDMSDGDRWVWLFVGVMSVLAASTALAALLGLGARDWWGPIMGWTSVVALTLTLLGTPIAAAVGWGLAQAKGRLVADPPRPGGAARLGGATIAGALLMVLVVATATWGWTHPFAAAAPVTTSNNTPTACTILRSGTPIAASAVGSDCGFRVASTLVQLDCRNVSGLPQPLERWSFDHNTSKEGGGGTMVMGTAGCHLTSPAYFVESDIKAIADLDPTDVLMVADFLPPQGLADLGFAYGCDTTGCIAANLFTVDSSIYISEDANPKLGSQAVKTQAGVNRLMLAIQGKTVRVWFNGNLIETLTASRIHAAGKYSFYLLNYEKSKAMDATLVQFGVYRVSS
jgi:serine/threonine protein kinase